MSMPTSWSQDQLQKREIQRLWPEIDSNLRRGTLHPSFNATKRSSGALEPSGTGTAGNGGASSSRRKRQRMDRQQQTSASEPDLTLLEDGTLENPSIPGVSPTTSEQIIKEIFKSMKKCGVCGPCRARAAGQSHPETRCAAIKAVKAWDAEFGGVSYAKAEELATKLAQPRMSRKAKNGKSLFRNKKRVGDGLRCDACRSCRKNAEWRRKCNFVEALVTKTVPERFTQVVEAAEAAVLESFSPRTRSTLAAATGATGGAQQITIEQYIHQMPGMNTNSTNNNNNTTVEKNSSNGDDEMSEDDDDELDDEEENLRWSSWAPFLSLRPHNPQAHTNNRTIPTTTTTTNAVPSDFKQLPTKKQVKVLSEKLDVEPESLIDWICTARVAAREAVVEVIEEEERGPQNGGASGSKNKNTTVVKAPSATRSATDGAALPTTDYEECGHVNNRNIFHCESCNTPRWSGPVGQLSTRIISALQSGILSGTAGRTTADIDTELASTVAARIAAEAGPGAGELLEMGELMDQVYSEVQRVRKARSSNARTATAGAVVVGARQKKEEDELKGIGSIARRTKMGKSVVKLENAVGRLVEEQTALVDFTHRADKKKTEERKKKRKKIGQSGGDGVLNTYQKRMEELLQLRSLLLEAKEHPYNWEEEEITVGAAGAGATTPMPSSSKRQRSSKSGASAIEQPRVLGYTAFSQRILRSLTSPAAAAAAGGGGYQSLVELLFISAPPIPSSSSSLPAVSSLSASSTIQNKWTEARAATLQSLLVDAEATKQLMLASQIGGSGSFFRHVLWALLQRQQQKQQQQSRGENAPAQGGGGTGSGGGAGGSQRLGLNSSQPSPRINPFLIPTQQSQPDPSSLQPLSQSQLQPQSQSQQHGALAAAAGEATTAASLDVSIRNLELGVSIALIDDLINVIRPSTITTAAGEEEEIQEESVDEDVDQHKFNVTSHSTSTTLACVYQLVHAVLNGVAQKEAKRRMPVHLTPFVKTILEHAAFPRFPPLPLPVEMTTTAATAKPTTKTTVPNRFDIHSIVKPIPDSRTPVQGMVKGIRPLPGRSKKILNASAAREGQVLPQAGAGAFSAFKPVESNSERGYDIGGSARRDGREGERNEQQQREHEGEAVGAEVIKKCPADVQLVFSEGINLGIRPEVVYKAALRYLETVGLEK
jgi:hypothetical protein